MNSLFLLAFGLVSAGAWSAPPAPSCAGKPDGYIELGCWGYHRCSQGQVTTLVCQPGQVMERDSLSCVTQGQGHSTCGVDVNCAGLSDGMYEDLSDNCASYFTCAGGQFLGHDYCPDNLFFNQAQQICDWATNVPRCFSGGNPGPVVTAAPTQGSIQTLRPIQTIRPNVQPTNAPTRFPFPTNGPVQTQPPSGALVVPPAPSCAGLQDGYIELGCWGYHRCSQGQVNTLVCQPGQVMERDSLSCVTQGTGHTVCGNDVSCAGVPNGLYEDLYDNCESYFECFNGKFLGHNYCPGNLYFNQKMSSCDYPQNVPHCFPGVSVGPPPGK